VSGSSLRVVLVTTPDAATAESLAQHLVEERLAACGNIVPGVTSIFRWDGGVQRDSEILLMLKSTQSQVEALTGRIVEMHPYDVPEVLVIPVEGGNASYLDWVASSVGGTS
jgi:periplasmic divalent cation tolerance protein